MSLEVKVPAVGESISSGVVSVWHKKSGEQVSAGDPLFTLETDKVSTEINAEKDGVLKTLVPEGAEVKIGDVVATIEEGNGAKAATKNRTAPREEPPAEKAPDDHAEEKPAATAQPESGRFTRKKMSPL